MLDGGAGRLHFSDQFGGSVFCVVEVFSDRLAVGVVFARQFALQAVDKQDVLGIKYYVPKISEFFIINQKCDPVVPAKRSAF